MSKYYSERGSIWFAKRPSHIYFSTLLNMAFQRMPYHIKSGGDWNIFQQLNYIRGFCCSRSMHSIPKTCHSHISQLHIHTHTIRLSIWYALLYYDGNFFPFFVTFNFHFPSPFVICQFHTHCMQCRMSWDLAIDVARVTARTIPHTHTSFKQIHHAWQKQRWFSFKYTDRAKTEKKSLFIYGNHVNLTIR